MISIKEITLRNIRSYFEGYLRSFMIKFFQGRLEHIYEQVEYRKSLVSAASPVCINEGKCKVCGCKTPELFYADKSCENVPPCYPPLVGKNEWLEQKNLNSI